MAGNDTEGLRYGAIETPEKYYLKWVEETDDFASEPNCGCLGPLMLALTMHMCIVRPSRHAKGGVDQLLMAKI